MGYWLGGQRANRLMSDAEAPVRPGANPEERTLNTPFETTAPDSS